MPEILLVDDATCGLDSRTAKEVMATLSSVARSGLAVLAIVHQPSARAFRSVDEARGRRPQPAPACRRAL